MAGARTADFDPVEVGRSECLAWSAYYRRDWPGVLRGATGMVRSGFGLGPLASARGAWHILRANQAWAPYPDNDPTRARREMASFYALVNRAGRVAVDPTVAAELEVRWWQVHRVRQHDRQRDDESLVAAVTALYAYVYRRPPEAVHRAATLRVQAMMLSDAWVAAGARLSDPTLDMERMALVASYTSLRDALERTGPVAGGR
ncbi:MAG: hypothetical protein JWP61_1252 [Friedmanniella sp.]|nr:hypothetical protein [Friedmanniella sp.]